MTQYVVEIPGRPRTLNHISSAGHWEKSAEIKRWREAAGWELKAIKAKALQPPVDLEFTQLCTPRKMPDHIAATMAIKAITDSLVDRGVIPDDDGRYVRRIILNAPIKTDRDALRLVVSEVHEA